MVENVPEYGQKQRPPGSPTIALSKDNHEATKAVTREWMREKTGRPVGGKVDWKQVSPREMQALTEKMFDAAKVPQAARDKYYRALNQFLYEGNVNWGNL
ncbi:hypothetical protein HYE60_06275 [Aggregatibacter actinomycetemcomitans]|nr:hypothetical protein [Aggregatibacter actinomycetemcomitans]